MSVRKQIIGLLAGLVLIAEVGCRAAQHSAAERVIIGSPDTAEKTHAPKGPEESRRMNDADRQTPERPVTLVAHSLSNDVQDEARKESPAESPDKPLAETEDGSPAVSRDQPLDESLEQAPLAPPTEFPGDPNSEPLPDSAARVSLDDVITSVYRSYPLLESALFARNITLGQQVSATGAFDTKLKGSSENGPTGFYQTYRQSIGLIQPTYWGGEVFGGYRIGRGDFQPWYLERQTNDGGELKAGVQVPLARNRAIDGRRAELWKAGLARQMAEPEIQAQLIGFVQDASYAWWDWVAAGENHGIATRLLQLADDRTDRIREQVDKGLTDPPELTDNERLVAIRRAKVADTNRKLQQTAAKLSLYLRTEEGEPVMLSETALPGFPAVAPVTEQQFEADVTQALRLRPELRALDLLRRQIGVDSAEAENQLQPELDAVVWGSQDTGAPTSSKRDKSEFEAEASLYLDVPLQRRKARGKLTELQGKQAQLTAKRRLMVNKIRVDLQMAYAAMTSAYEQVQQTEDAVAKAEDLAARERRNLEVGASDMLKVTLREQYAAESAEKSVEALRMYFESLADYRAAMARDQIDR